MSRKPGGSTGAKKAAGKGWTPHPLGAKPRDVLEIPILNNGMQEKTPHPTQKPLELIRRLVEASSNPGDLVVDPFGGSGTTAVVCELLGRGWAVCERDADYVGWAAERISAVVSGEFTEAGLRRDGTRMAENRTRVRG